MTVPESQGLFAGCVFVLANYDALKDDIRGYAIGLIEKHGGRLSPEYNESCTHVLTQYQYGQVYEQVVCMTW